ncbi:hypothetical protein BESB_077520 [Besnoitia besnoiti]|uniref:Uncharacterized protein n=1 Tax=Besnoitia besnoiti TaxID=94643 RepID=A0A2A9M6D5_BESBE|nr:hypothetical protein BESB_077520 [Besnoitia besnoiti]PFH33535.1 hypothetical protein BESB_077520 [Besnoitia besnoiti]
MTVDCPCEKSVCSWLVASTGGGKEATQASAAGVPHMAPNPVEDTRALGDSGDGRRDNEARVSETSTRRRASDGNPTMRFEISSYSPYGSGLIEQVLPVEDTVPLSVICPTDSSSAPSSLDWRRTQHVWGATCASLPSSASPLAAVLSPGRRVVQLNGHRADTQGETVVRRQRDKPSNTAVSRAWLKSSGELYIEPLRDAVSQVGPTQAHAAQSRTSRLGVGASAPRESAELGLVSESTDDEHSGVQEAEDRGGKKSSEETQAPYAHGSVAVVSATTTETARNILLRCLGPTGTTEGPAADGGMPERLKRSSFIPDALARSPAPNDSVKLVCDKSRPADKAVSRPDTGCKHTYMQEGKTESVGARTGSSPDAKQPSHSCVSEAVDQHAMWCIFMHASGALVRKTISQLGQRACLSKDTETGVWQWAAARGVVGTRGKANEDHHMRLPIYEVKTLHAQLWKAFNASSATQ